MTGPAESVLRRRWRLVTAAVAHRSGPRAMEIDAPAGRLSLRFGDEALADAMARLRDGVTETELHDAAAAIPDGAARAQLHLIRLVRAGLLEMDVASERGVLVTLLPRTRSFTVPDRCAPSRIVLSRFAYLRPSSRGMMLAEPDATAEAVLGDDERCVGWIADVARPLEMRTIAGDAERVDLMRLLHDVGFLVDADAAEPAARQTWEFHDRLFQRAARSYADFVPRGGTYRFAGRLPPQPAVRPPYEGVDVPLPVPPPGDRSAGGLRDAMERRRSRRAMGSRCVTLARVAELLYRVARITECASDGPHEVMYRPYPSGGAVHELEFYLAIGACEGLAAGFYHYRGREHALTRLEHGDAPAATMLTDAANSWAQPDEPPQALVVISSRLPRLAWKYEGIAYKISLLDAGVALQSLSLIAEDIGLNAAVSGSGNPELFAAATGVDPFEETSIAEFGFGCGPKQG